MKANPVKIIVFLAIAVLISARARAQCPSSPVNSNTPSLPVAQWVTSPSPMVLH